MSKPLPRDHPPLDWDFPPPIEWADRIARVPLPATLRFVAEDRWIDAFRETFESEVLLRPELDAVAKRLVDRAGETVARVYYLEDEDQGLATCTPGGAVLEIALRLGGSRVPTLEQWLRMAASGALTLPEVDFGTFYFMPDREATVKSGIPAWDDFLAGHVPALPETYVIEFASADGDRARIVEG